MENDFVDYVHFLNMKKKYFTSLLACTQDKKIIESYKQQIDDINKSLNRINSYRSHNKIHKSSTTLEENQPQ